MCVCFILVKPLLSYFLSLSLSLIQTLESWPEAIYEAHDVCVCVVKHADSLPDIMRSKCVVK